MGKELPDNLREALERAAGEFCATLILELGIRDGDYRAEELVIWQGWGQRIRLNGEEFDLTIGNTYELQRLVEEANQETIY